MSPTLVRDKEESNNTLSLAFKTIAKNFLLLPDIARDLNIVRQNLVEYAKIKGAEVSTTPDSSFIPEKDFVPAPTPVKKEELEKIDIEKVLMFLAPKIKHVIQLMAKDIKQKIF